MIRATSTNFVSKRRIVQRMSSQYRLFLMKKVANMSQLQLL